MQAYKQKDLYNKIVQEYATEAFEMQNIDADTFKKILEAHKSALYTPNFFIRIAFALLTFIAVLFSGLLLSLIVGFANDRLFTIFLCIACYSALEMFIKQKQYYNAGIDNTLMCCCIIFLVSFFLIDDFPGNNIIACISTSVFSLWLCLRFTDAFMALVSFISSYLLTILLFSKAGLIGEVIVPFALMFFSVIIYLLSTKLLKNESAINYHFSCKSLRFISAISFYISANYLIINEAGKAMFSSTATMPLPLSIFYWMLTLLIPIAYLLYGIRKKDLLFIRIGFVLLVATIFTIRYYHQLLATEIDMLIGGLILIAISYALIKYLQTAKHDYTFENTNRNKKELMNIEALIIAQVFGKSTHKQKGFEFGGGSSGGGGATGNY